MSQLTQVCQALVPVEPLVGILAHEVDGAADLDLLIGSRQAVDEPKVPEALQVGCGAFLDL